jgi:hypothetical protein
MPHNINGLGIFFDTKKLHCSSKDCKKRIKRKKLGQRDFGGYNKCEMLGGSKSNEQDEKKG